MSKKEQLLEEIDKLFWNVPLDPVMKKVRKSVLELIEKEVFDTSNPPLFYPKEGKYLIIDGK
jgi:hypothetical protein